MSGSETYLEGVDALSGEIFEVYGGLAVRVTWLTPFRDWENLIFDARPDTANPGSLVDWSYFDVEEEILTDIRKDFDDARSQRRER